MKKRSLLILPVIALLFASCGKKGGKSGLLVPKDAAFVMHINSSSLSSKLSWEDIRQTNWFKMASKDATDSLSQKLLADPSSSGIDTKKDFVLYMKQQGRGSYVVFEGSLTSQATYEQLLTELSKKEPREIKKDGDFSYMTDNKNVVVWNKTMFALVSNANLPSRSRLMKRGMGGGDDEANAFTSDSLRIFGEQALTIEGGENLDADSRFADLVKDGSDMHVWFNFGKISGGSTNPMLSMMNINSLLENNVTAISMNFDNGKISVKSKHYSNETMNKIASDNKPTSISADVINRIPSSDVYAVFAFNYSPSALKETLKVTGLNTMADAFLKQVDFSIDDFVKANKGEIVLAVSDVAARKTDPMANSFSSKPDVKYLFATAVKDKASFEKMVTLAWDLSKQMKNKYGARDSMPDTGTPSIPGVSYRVEKDWFALSNSPDYTDKFLAGSSNNKFAFTDKITGHPVGAYIDLQKVLRFAGSMPTEDSSKAEAINLSLNMWQDIVARGGDFNGKYSEMEFEVNLVDKNTNSLKQLNQYIDKLSVLKGSSMKWKSASMKEGVDDIKIEDIKVAVPSTK